MKSYYHSRLEEIEKIPEVEERIYCINELLGTFLDSYPEGRAELIQRYIAICKSISYVDGEVLLRINLAYVFGTERQLKKSEEELALAIALLPHCKKTETLRYTYSILAYIHWFKGEYGAAFNKIFESLKYDAQMAPGEKRGTSIGWCYYALGIFYFDTKDFLNSELYYKKAAEYFTETNYGYGLARAKNGLASIMILQENYEESEKILNEILPVYKQFDMMTGITRVLTDLGLIKKHKREYESALKLHTEAYAIRKETNHVQGIITSLIELGHTNFFLQNLETAKQNLEEAISVALQTNAKAKLFQAHQLLSGVYKSLNDPWKALEHLEKFYEIRSEVLGEQASNKMKQLQTEFATEKSEKETEIQRLKNVELKTAYDEIENKNREITDSIRYAYRIQRLLMPMEKNIEKMLSALNKN